MWFEEGGGFKENYFDFVPMGLK